MIDYLSSNLWLVWTLICVLALILEVSSGTFYLMCFAVGAACSIITSLFPTPLWVQVLVFAVASAVCVFCVRPFVVKYVHPGHDNRVSNADALIGRTGTVIEPITPEKAGYVKVDGDEWRAVTDDGEIIPKGEEVVIKKRDSIIVTVTKK
jgi:membrane protein implicated in regulation of membrane protease activity